MKTQTTTLRFPGEGYIFFEIVKFYSSYKSCNEWVSAYSRFFGLLFVLGYADSTSLKFRVLAYS